MLQSEILSIVSILIGFVCVVLAVFLFSVKVKRAIANKLFAVFLLLTAIDVSGWALSSGLNLSEAIENFRVSLTYLQMPFFLGFIVASCNANFSLRPVHLLHAIPFVLVVILYCLIELDWRAVNATLHIQYYLYIGLAVWLLLRFRTVFRDHFSDARSEVFTWLMQLVIASLFAHTLVVIKTVAYVGQAYSLFFSLQMIGALLVLAIMTWITLKALLHPELFRGVDKNLLLASRRLSPGQQAATDDSQKAARLEAFMHQAQPHLDADLSLQSLAEQLALSQRELSELINNNFGMHFFDFVNRYRVELAKTLLIENKEKSVLEVLNTVGFNSKSSFNTAFKKHTGMTPTAFRKRQ